MSAYTKSAAFTGLGLVLSIETVVSPLTLVEIGEVKKFAGPAFKGETADVTNVQSPGGVKEFIATLVDPGELTFEVNYVPGDPGQAAFFAALVNSERPRLTFQLTLPPSSLETVGDVPGYWTFTGLPVEYNVDMDPSKEATVALKVKVSGLPIYTPETA